MAHFVQCRGPPISQRRFAGTRDLPSPAQIVRIGSLRLNKVSLYLPRRFASFDDKVLTSAWSTRTARSMMSARRASAKDNDLSEEGDVRHFSPYPPGVHNGAKATKSGSGRQIYVTQVGLIFLVVISSPPGRCPRRPRENI